MKYFWPYRFDDKTGDLWRHATRVPVTPKASDVLRCLLARAGAPVPTAAILSDVWRGVHVHPANVKALVYELRTALGATRTHSKFMFDDGPASPEFIRSEAGRGYTFVAGVTDAPVPLCTELLEAGDSPELLAHGPALDLIVGRFTGAKNGATGVVLVEGERRIGKTALSRRVAFEAHRQGPMRITCGQTGGALGAAQPFDVITDALTLLLRQYPALAGPLREVAPTWAHHLRSGMRGAIDDGKPGTIGRLLRELHAALAELSRESALLIVLEDLQWSDVATLEALRYLAHASTPTNVCVVATYCANEGPLGSRLQALSREIGHESSTMFVRLQLLSVDLIGQYLDRKFGRTVARVLAGPVRDVSAGHPYLIHLALEAIVQMGALHRTGGQWALTLNAADVPGLFAAAVSETWRLSLEQLDPARRRVLEACACFGLECRSADVASLLSEDPDALERCLAEEASRGLFVERLPGVSGAAGGFGFRTPLVAELLAATTTDRVRLGLPDWPEDLQARRA